MNNTHPTLQKDRSQGGVAGWSCGDHYPFVVYAMGPAHRIRWHVQGPGFNTAHFHQGFPDNRDAESIALYQKRVRDLEIANRQTLNQEKYHA